MATYKEAGSKRTRRCPRLALCCILISLLVIVGLLIGIITLAVKKDKNPTVCTTPHCVMIAGDMMRKIDPEVNPCDNFYEYACGGWLKTTLVPADQSGASTWDVLHDKLKLALKTLFEQPISHDDIDVTKKVKRYYAECMDLDTMEERDAQPLLQLLHDHGGFPVLGDKFGGRWNETDFDLETLMGRVKPGARLIIGTEVKIDEKNSTRHITYVDQPPSLRDLFLGEHSFLGRKLTLDYMVAIITMLGVDNTTATRDMTDVMELGTKLANISTPKSERLDVDDRYHLTTLANLTKDAPEFNWVQYFDVVMPEENKPFPSTEEIVNNSPEFITEAVKLLKEDTQPRIIANYIMWHLAANRIGLLSDRFREVLRKHLKVLGGDPSNVPLFHPDRLPFCTTTIKNSLQFAIGRMYVDEYLAAENKANVEEMIARLKKAFKSMLEYNDWMNEETKMAAIEKIESMREKIGYPDWILDDDLLNDFYKKFIVEDKKYFEITGSEIEFLTWKQLTKLRRPNILDKEWWTSDDGPAVVNAFYYRGSNSIVFPAGILHAPWYHKESPRYLNYGGIGETIGHEITHGLDYKELYKGRKKDKDENVKQLWSTESSENFNDRAECVVNQYNQYLMPEINKYVNGLRTLSENIADIGGIKASYTAYKESGYFDVKLPGFENFTQEQMLFLNFAQKNCEISKMEDSVNSYHSHGRYRTIGPLQNSIDFANAFACPEGSYMNPPAKDKCVVW